MPTRNPKTYIPRHVDKELDELLPQLLNEFELLDAAKGDWPVNWVKWYGAYAFADYYGVALPSEAQWECAARGGQQLEYPTDDGMKWSPNFGQYAKVAPFPDLKESENGQAPQLPS